MKPATTSNPHVSTSRQRPVASNQCSPLADGGSQGGRGNEPPPSQSFVLGALSATLFRTLGILAACIALAFLSVANATEIGTLVGPVQIPIIYNNRVAGSTTLQAGTQVQVLQANGDKLLIATASSKAWVAKTSVASQTPVTPATPTAPVAATAPAVEQASPENAAPVQNPNTEAPAYGKNKVRVKCFGGMEPSTNLINLFASAPWIDAEKGGYGLKEEDVANNDVFLVKQASLSTLKDGFAFLLNTKGKLLIVESEWLSISEIRQHKDPKELFESIKHKGEPKAHVEFSPGNGNQCAILVYHDPYRTVGSDEAVIKEITKMKAVVENLPPRPAKEVREHDKFQATEKKEVPKDYNLDSTLILPGEFVFIAMPFEKQARSGICVASAAVNVFKYQFPEIQLEQEEFFRILNNDDKGSHYNELSVGLLNIGLSIGPALKGQEIMKALDENKPLLAFIPGHVLTIIGYNKGGKSLIAWDQRSTQEGASITIGDSRISKNLPKGAYEIDMSKPTKIESIYALRNTALNYPDVRTVTPVEELSRWGEENKLTDVKEHNIFKASLRRDTFQEYLGYALPSLLTMLGRQGRTAILETSNGPVRIPPQSVEKPNSKIEVFDKYGGKKTTTTTDLASAITAEECLDITYNPNGNGLSSKTVFRSGKAVSKPTPDPAPMATPVPTSAEAEAEYRLGLDCRDGVGVEKNRETAIAHFRKAAELGSLEADLQLGNYVTSGIRSAAPVDWPRIIDVWRKDAENGNAGAQFALAEAYYYMRGVKHDLLQAIFWYEKAAQQGNTWARKKLEPLKLREFELRNQKDWETMLSWKTWPEGVSRIFYFWKKYPIEKEDSWSDQPWSCLREQALAPASKVGGQDFNFERTVIIPGLFTYIALPMMRQEGGREWDGTAAVNLMEYLDPDFALSPSEFLNVLNEEKGADFSELERAVRNVGFILLQQKLDGNPLGLLKLHDYLDRDFPLLLTSKGIEIAIVGYNAKACTYIGWDPKSVSNGAPIKTPWGVRELPKGCFEMEANSLLNNIAGFLIPIQGRQPVNNGRAERIQQIIHEVDARCEPFNKYLGRALPPILKELFAKYGSVEFDKDSTIFRIDPVENGRTAGSQIFLLTDVDSGKLKEMTAQQLADFISENAMQSPIAGDRITKEQKAALRQLSLWTKPKATAKAAQ